MALKKNNQYNLRAGYDVYEAAPKSVWAAIAISRLTCGGDDLDNARALVLEEWQILFENGIVPQEPPKRLTTGS